MAKKTEAAKKAAATAKTKTRAARAKSKERVKKISKAPHSHLHGFATFVREKGVVGLAIGLAIGTAASGLVTQIVNAVITPTVGLIVGKQGLDGLNTTIAIGDRSEVFAFGDLIDALIKFIAIAAVIYFVVLGLKLDRLDKKKED
jgi:large conductance mechanosensitive channel protein